MEVYLWTWLAPRKDDLKNTRLINKHHFKLSHFWIINAKDPELIRLKIGNYTSLLSNEKWFKESVAPKRNPPRTWRDIAESKLTPWEYIINNPDLPWEPCGVSSNPNVNIKIVLSKPTNYWNWVHLSKNPGISFSDIMNNPQLPWEWFGVSSNPNVTWLDVLSNRTKKWYWFILIDQLNDKYLEWEPNLTRYYPYEFRRFIRFMLMLRKKIIPDMPREILYIIIKLVIKNVE